MHLSINASNVFKCCLSSFATIIIRVSTLNFKDFPLFLLLTPHVQLVPLLEVRQPLMSSAKLLIYSAHMWLHTIMFESRLTMVLALAAALL
jgi:hypothetical protein